MPPADTQKRPGKTRVKRATQREEILDAAFRVLERDGPHFGLADAAEEARVSKALVFHHFGSREGLLDAMAARVMQETQLGVSRIADERRDKAARTEALARTLLEEPLDSTPTQARHVLAFWLLTDATGACRGALRDALLADFVGDARAAELVLSRWHGATVRYATGRAVDFEREADALVDELRKLR